MVVIVTPLVKSNARWPKEILIQPLLGERQITNVPFAVASLGLFFREFNKKYKLYKILNKR